MRKVIEIKENRGILDLWYSKNGGVKKYFSLFICMVELGTTCVWTAQAHLYEDVFQ